MRRKTYVADHETLDAEYAFLDALRAIAACHAAQDALMRKFRQSDALSFEPHGRYFMNRFSVSNEYTPSVKRSGVPGLEVTRRAIDSKRKR